MTFGNLNSGLNLRIMLEEGKLMKSLFDKTHRSSLSTRTVGLSVVCLLGITAVGLGYNVSRANAHNGKSPPSRSSS